MEKTHKSKKEQLERNKQMEALLKTLDGSRTPEEKFELVLSKCVELERALHQAQQDAKKKDKLLEQVLSEKEQQQRELNRAVQLRSKLESLCREQQAINKSLKNESLAQIKLEEKRRKELQLKFQQSLDDITQALAKHNDENVKLRAYNDEMSKKLQYFGDHYKTRDQQCEKLNEQLEVAQKLHAAKENKLNVELEMEREIMNRERIISQQKLIKAQEQIKELLEGRMALKEQCSLYSAKYDEFNQSMKKSNDLFTSYKNEIDKLSKTTVKHEKEAASWRQMYEKCNAKLIMLATEKRDNDNHVARCSKQVEMLQKLLRAMQAERSHLLKELRAHNIELSELPDLPPEPAAISTDPQASERLAAMAKNCEELKLTMATLQNKVDQLSTTEKPVSLPPPTQKSEPESTRSQKRTTNNKKKQKASRANKEATPTSAAVLEVKSVTNGDTKEHNECDSVSDVVSAEPAAASSMNEQQGSVERSQELEEQALPAVAEVAPPAAEQKEEAALIAD